MNASDYAAWYGAIVATGVFAWEVWKDAHSGARLRVTASPNMVQAGNGQIGTKQMIFVTVVNYGDQPTEITHFLGQYYPTKRDMRRKKNAKHFIVPWNGMGPAVPYKLEPGGRWTGGIDQSGMLEFGSAGFLLVGVADSFTGKNHFAVVPYTNFTPPRSV